MGRERVAGRMGVWRMGTGGRSSSSPSPPERSTFDFDLLRPDFDFDDEGMQRTILLLLRVMLMFAVCNAPERD